MPHPSILPKPMHPCHTTCLLPTSNHYNSWVVQHHAPVRIARKPLEGVVAACHQAGQQLHPCDWQLHVKDASGGVASTHRQLRLADACIFDSCCVITIMPCVVVTFVVTEISAKQQAAQTGAMVG